MQLGPAHVLYISYNGMLDPLGQSQVIPYLKELSKEGVRFALLSFERAGAYEPKGVALCRELRDELASYGIDWHWLRYHQTPSLPATVYDVVAGVRYSRRLVQRKRIELVHARSYIPVTIALALRKRFGTKVIFDLRGLMGEEYVEAGHWRRGSIPYRLTKAIERRALAASDGIVTLTDAVWEVIRAREGLRKRTVAHVVIPCCVDLDRFKFNAEARERNRRELGIENRFVLVYSGSIGGWYMTGEMADFFVTLLRNRSDAYFLWLANGPPAIVERAMQARGVKSEQYTVRTVQSAEMPSYLSAADLGIAFYKPGISRLGTSPVKVSEYLACSLPIIINAGLGDSDALVTREGVGTLVASFTEGEYLGACAAMSDLLTDVDGTRRRARAVAERMFDVRRVGRERYLRLYEEVRLNTYQAAANR